jgi:hypothetical protein
MKAALIRSAIATSTVACVALLSFSWSEQRGISPGVESAQAGTIDRQPDWASLGLRVGGLIAGTDCGRTQSPPPPRPGITITIIAMVILTQVGATLLAIIIAATLAATASAVATLPDSTQSRHCFRATTATGAGEAIFVAVDSILACAGTRAYLAGPNTSITTHRSE